jgi:hypothetical protein
MHIISVFGTCRKCLGSVDISTQPDESANEAQKAKIAFGQLLKSRENATIVLDLANEALD